MDRSGGGAGSCGITSLRRLAPTSRLLSHAGSRKPGAGGVGDREGSLGPFRGEARARLPGGTTPSGSESPCRVVPRNRQQGAPGEVTSSSREDTARRAATRNRRNDTGGRPSKAGRPALDCYQWRVWGRPCRIGTIRAGNLLGAVWTSTGTRHPTMRTRDMKTGGEDGKRRLRRRDPLRGIVIARGDVPTPERPRISAFIWGGKVRPTPTLPYGRWKGVG
jgi:hypothetical protein